jgi:hypothetical protein
LYVQRFTGDGDADAKTGRVQVSTNGANGPLFWWSADGKEIRYLDSGSQLMSVRVRAEPTFSPAPPNVLYSIKDLKTRSFAFGPEGRPIVVLQGESERTTKTVGLVVNFLEELRAKMATAK